MIGKNNPFNIRYNHINNWKGLCGSTRGFCDFKYEYFGVRAAMYLIMKSYKRKKIETIAQIIKRFAPSSENDSVSYYLFICDKTNMYPFDIPERDIEWISLFHYMTVYEGNSVPSDTIARYYYKFKKEG